jgi:hypothetical protein
MPDEWRDPIIEPFQDAQYDLLNRICAIRAVTLAGHVARARTYNLWDPNVLMRTDAEDEDGGWDDRLLAALLRDMVGVAGAAEIASLAALIPGHSEVRS